MASSLDLLFRIQGDNTGQERALIKAEQAQRRYDLAIRQANAEMEADFKQRADAAAKAAEDQARRQSAAYDKAGTALLGFGAVVGVGLGLAGKAAIDWESDWASVQKTVVGADDQMEQSLRDLTDVLPATHEEIANVAAAAGALGIQTPNVVKFTKTMIDLGEATDDLDAQTAATELAQFMNVMGTGQGDVDRLASSLVALGNNGASTEGQILDLGQRLTAAGRIARLSEGDVLGFASALTSVGIDAEAGGTAFSKVFIAIDDAVKTGNANLQTFAQVAGMSTAEFSRAFREDAAGAIVSFVEGLGRMDQSGQSLTSTLDAVGLADERVRRSLLSASGAGELLREQIDLGNRAWDENTALLLEVARRYETTESKIKIARNQINDAAIDIGQKMLPALAGMASGVADAADWFTKLPGPIQSTLVGLGGITATSALVIGATLKIRSSLESLNKTMADAPGLARATSIGLKGLGALAIAGGVVVGLQQITNALSDIFDPSFDTSKLRSDLIRLGATGKTTGTLLDITGGSLDDLRSDFEKFEDSSFIDQGFFGFGANSFVKNLERVDDALADLVNGGDISAAQMAIKQLADAWAPKWQVSPDEAIDRITRALPQYSDALQSAKVDAEGLTGAQADLAAGADGVVGTLDDVKAGADGIYGSLDDVSGAMDDTKASAEKLSPEAQNLADKFSLTDEAATGAATALDDLDSTLSALADKWLGQQEATDALQQSMNDLVQEIADAKDSGDDWVFALDGTSDAALHNRDVMDDLLRKNLAVVESWDKSKLTSDEFKTKIDAQKEAFIQWGVQLGYRREDLEKYAGIFDQIPTDLPLDVENKSLKDAKIEAGFLHGALKALEEPTVLDVDDTAAREKGTAWQNDAAHFFADHTVGVDTDDSDARFEGERWLTDAQNHYYIPHTVGVDEDDAVARQKGLDWRTFADGIFGDRTVHVDVDVDIPYQDIEWLEQHLPRGPGGRMADQGYGDGSRGAGGSGYGDGGRGFSVPADGGATGGFSRQDMGALITAVGSGRGGVQVFYTANHPLPHEQAALSAEIADLVRLGGALRGD